MLRSKNSSETDDHLVATSLLELAARGGEDVDDAIRGGEQVDQVHLGDKDDDDDQGGRTWQAFGGGKNGHETFRQERIYNFRDKCVVFPRNLKFLNLTQ